MHLRRWRNNVARIGRYLTIGMMLLPWLAVAQNTVSISGKVVDVETKKPIKAASVYLIHSLMGSASNIEGRYVIQGISPGAYTLVVSRIGYESQWQEILLGAENGWMELNFALTPEVYALDGVGVVAERPRRWRRRFELFNKLFLGTMPFEEHARLLNPYGLEFREERGLLTAFSEEVLVIENDALGYRILFQLMGFEWNKRERILKFTGAGYFEYMDSEEESTRKMWAENRASRGSNYSWLAHANPSLDAWKARTIDGRCACSEYKFGFEGAGVCQCTYNTLWTPRR